MALFLCMALLFSGCGTKNTEETAKATESAEVAPSAEETEGTEVTPSAEETEGTGGIKETQKAEETQGKDTSLGTKSNTKNVELATPATSGALQVVGAQLCDESGNPVQLRGLSTHGIGWFPEYVNSELFSQFRNEWSVNVVRLAMYTAEGAGYCTGGDTTY